MEEWDDFEGSYPWETQDAPPPIDDPEMPSTSASPVIEEIVQPDEDDEPEPEKPLVTISQVLLALEAIKQYAVSRGMNLKRLNQFEDEMTDDLQKAKVQSRLTDFFTATRSE